MSYNQAQRGYLLCQLSAVSCKRSLPVMNDIENSSEIDFDDYILMCIALRKPFHVCLDEIAQKRIY